MVSPRQFAAVLLLAFAVTGGLLTALFSQFVSARPADAELAAMLAAPGGARGLHRVEYMPPMPGDAPEPLRNTVETGFQWVQLDASHLGNGLRCSHCHFRGGLTEGGKNGGISLVGAAARDPLHLSDKINNCLRVDLNATTAETPDKLAAANAYLVWISKGIPLYATAPWLGIAPLQAGRPPEPAAGQKTFAEVCAQCHGPDGQGTPIAPAVWGPRSFTTAASMARLELLASFVHLNMPRQNPTLTPGQAVDAAAYVLAQSRPAPQRP